MNSTFVYRARTWDQWERREILLTHPGLQGLSEWEVRVNDVERTFDRQLVCRTVRAAQFTARYWTYASPDSEIEREQDAMRGEP